MPPPYVVKPVNEGSSVGVIIVKEARSHPPQELSRPDWPYGETMLAEEFIALGKKVVVVRFCWRIAWEMLAVVSFTHKS